MQGAETSGGLLAPIFKPLDDLALVNVTCLKGMQELTQNVQLLAHLSGIRSSDRLRTLASLGTGCRIHLSFLGVSLKFKLSSVVELGLRRGYWPGRRNVQPYS